MSMESYIAGFSKAAAAHGFNPQSLANYVHAHEMLKVANWFADSYANFGTKAWSSNVGAVNPPPSVSQVLNAINMAGVQGVGTSNERRDAFGKIINSGLTGSSPAYKALRMIGGGLLGRAITGAFTNNSLLKGFGTGFGAMSAIRH